MDAELHFLVHFFNDRAFLFKTITMAGASQVDAICDAVSDQKGWWNVRYSHSDRQIYLNRRRFVEQALYDDYTQEYGPLKEKVPVYFYLYPNITRQMALERARLRTHFGEVEPQVLMIHVEDLEATRNITFTLNDSFTAYWQKARDAGVQFPRDSKDPQVLPDHNRVFPFSMIEHIHRRYRAQEIYYEVQVWDYQLLEKVRRTYLKDEEG